MFARILKIVIGALLGLFFQPVGSQKGSNSLAR
jgi:hypothetical protein